MEAAGEVARETRLGADAAPRYPHAVLLFVHDPKDADPLVSQFVGELRGGGVRVDYIDLDRRAPPQDHAAALEGRLRAHVVLGGFSWGARAAARSFAGANEIKPGKLLCLGFPFHPRGEPEDTRRLPTLESFPETLILQGERDAHGSRAWLRGRALPTRVRVEWIADGNHRFEPRAHGSATRERNLRRVIELATAFCG